MLAPLGSDIEAPERVATRYMLPDRKISRAPPSGNLISAVSPSSRRNVLPSLRAKPEACGRTDRRTLPKESVLPSMRVWACMALLSGKGIVVNDCCMPRDFRALSAAMEVSRYGEVS